MDTRKKNRGFTLIGPLAVIAIIGKLVLDAAAIRPLTRLAYGYRYGCHRAHERSWSRVIGQTKGEKNTSRLVTLAFILFLLVWVPAVRAHADNASNAETDSSSISMPGSPFGIAWGFLYGYCGTKAEVFMPELRKLDAGFTKLYLFWNQIEPEKGRYEWDAVDTFLKQLNSPEEALISIWSSSTWATRRSTAALPPSPAKDLDNYYRFVHQLVSHCKGKVRYWQNDCEPNSSIYWLGTAEEFVAQLRVFHQAVKDADPEAVVVVGGYNGVFNPPGIPPFAGQEEGLAFFDKVLKDGAEFFDAFDIRLYIDPYTIPARVDYMRHKMTDLGYRKPIICTEYNGPYFFDYPENRPYADLMGPWMNSITTEGGDGSPPGQKEVAASYDKMDTLAPQTQMFMFGCPTELDQKFRRLQCRDLVMRNVLALSAGVQKTLYWDLWDDWKSWGEKNLLAMIYGKMCFVDYEDGAVTKRSPVADAFKQMAKSLDGVELVKRIEVPEQSSIYLFEVRRRGRGPIYVIWDKRDAFSGEDQPGVKFEWMWRAPKAKAVDVFGQGIPVKVKHGRLILDVSVTPIFVEPVNRKQGKL
jgi:hypothetical protein